jgi:hypothetical protein
MSKLARGVFAGNRTSARRLSVVVFSLLAVAGTSTFGALASQAPVAAASPATWSIVPSPTTTSGTLSSVACTSASNCTAVGFYGSGVGQTLIEQWNGTAWSVVPSPNTSGNQGLSAVSCVSASACFAVGSLVEQWDGTAWSVVPSPNTSGTYAGGLDAVSCLSLSSCFAVGAYANGPLIEQWNGTVWSVMPSPNTGAPKNSATLEALSCTSASACTAVGTAVGSANPYYQTLIEQWNGTAWSIVPSPNVLTTVGNTPTANYLQGVSCTAASACIAVGYATGSALNGTTLVEQWNGSNWSIIPSPSPVVGSDAYNSDSLSGISCTSASACTAVGRFSSTANPARGPATSGPLVEQWDGTAWSVVASPSQAGGLLAGVTCSSASTCTAVGSSNNTGGFVETSVPSGGTPSGPVPTVTGVSPNSGLISGGTNVTITGTGFSGATSVTFGAAGATNVDVVNDSTITATSPSISSGGIDDVIVTTPGGSSPTSTADQFTYTYPVPLVTSLSPTSGPASGGTNVIVVGSGFTGATSVTFDGVAGSVSYNTDSNIVVSSPVLSPGIHNVLVTTPGGTSPVVTADQFTSVAPPPAPAPTVTSISPTSGPTAGGTTVTVKGTGFSGATQVHFGTVPASSFSVSSSTKITAVAPAGAAGSVDVLVSVPSGTSAAWSADQFTYVAPPPTPPPAVTSISPTSGPSTGGTSVTIRGTGFGGATQVLFGTVPASSFSVGSSTRITAVAPAETAGSHDIVVVSPNGTSATVAADQFTSVLTLPTVTSLSPTSGPTAGGTTVTIKGTGFSGVTQVSFGGLAATSFTVVSSTKITALAPAQAAGSYDTTVSTTNGTSKTNSNDQYTYKNSRGH